MHRVAAPPSRVLNVGIRLTTLGSKFVSVVGYGYFLPAHDMATFGVVTGLVAFSVYAVGLDFYTFANRQLVRLQGERRDGVLTSQAVVYGLMYLVACLVATATWVSGAVPLHMAAWFICILVVEHAAQELNRVLVVVDLQLAASLVMFVRSGLWGLLTVAAMILVPAARSVDVVFATWAACAAIGCALGFTYLARHKLSLNRRSFEADLVARGLRSSLPMLAGTLALVAVLTLDRTVVSRFGTTEALAAYTLFGGLANAMRSVLDASVHAHMLPKMLQAGSAGDGALMRRLQRRCQVETISIALLYGVGVLAVMRWMVAPRLDNFYEANLGLLVWLLIAMTVCVVGVPPQYVLFSLHRDRPLIASQVFGLIVFLATAFAVAPSAGPVGVPMAMLIAMIVMWAVKSWAARQALRGFTTAEGGMAT